MGVFGGYFGTEPSTVFIPEFVIKLLDVEDQFSL